MPIFPTARRRKSPPCAWPSKTRRNSPPSANDRLANHPRARPAIQERDIKALISRCQLGDCVSLEVNGRVLTLGTDPEKLKEAAKLDGCYVIKTDLTPQQAGKETVRDRYKDLSQVESGFRTCKTGHLEMRPVFVRLEESTRAQAWPNSSGAPEWRSPRSPPVAT